MTREQVIKGLECRKNAEMRCGNPCEETGNCKYATMIRDPSGEPYYPYICDRKKLCEDALALLKEQEPQVLTLEEVEALPYGHVLIETDKSGSLRWLDALLFCKNANFSFDFITLEGRARLLGTKYNREWRCWTSMPTDEQREAVKWEWV